MRYLLILLIIAPLTVLYSEDDRFASLEHYLLEYPGHFKDSYQQIWENNTNQNILKSYFVLTLVALPLDHPLQRYAVKHGLLPETLANFGDIWGNRLGPQLVLIGVPLIDYYRYKNTQRTLSLLEYIWESQVVTSTLTAIIKRVSHRQRPNGKGYLSYPSGHTSAAFATAEILRNIYGKQIGYPAYLLAIIVAISRLHDNKHYLSDVIGGATLGIVISKAFYQPHIRELERKTSKYTFHLQAGIQGIRVEISRLLP